MMYPAFLVIWVVVIGAGAASLSCLAKFNTIGFRSLIPSATIATSVLIVQTVPFTKLWLDIDFFLYKEKRSEIVEKIARGELEPNVDHNPRLISLGDSFPLLSMGGNEVIVEGHGDRKYVLFYTYRGILDNYSGFLYVPDGGNPSAFGDLNEFLSTRAEPMEKNWYFVSHR